MGLDMYLSAKKYMSKYFDESDTAKIEQVNKIFGVEGLEDNDYGAEEVKFRVAYWRKANMIHRWFVENCQDGEDNCDETYVSREDLEKLLQLCKDVMEDMGKAEELLPTQGGFFFGGVEYDQYYVGDIKYTAERLEKILTDKSLQKMDFYYQSSW